MKRCPNCESLKDLSAFYPHKSTKSGYSSWCKECLSKRNKEFYLKEKELIINRSKLRFEKNRHEMNERRKAWYYQNKHRQIQSNIRWAKNNREKVYLYASKRYQRLADATPEWLTDDHWKAIESVYAEASRTTELAGFDCQVDHIIPLNGKNVCGLHVPWNLRVVSKAYNCKKNNRLDEGVFFEPSKTGGVLIHNSALPWNWSSKNEHRV